ncbi:unnamed protein product [Psylliodes chrysocephalus]|uniref:5'-nucleotidase n=1 Tax=Psylliodes chrysocephalus TaxID=3402493 RepID=A0A9P0CTM3_9CUCU|nr:unnamed protein product [Psylliodes chrysocephala]
MICVALSCQRDILRLAHTFTTFGTKVKIKMKNYVCQVPELARTNVHIKNKELVNQKIKNLIEGGFDKLQVVSDFDKTLTKQHQNGKMHLSSFGIFSCCPSVTEEHTRFSTELNKKYAPCEVDPTISKPEKTKLMEEWWSLSEDSLRGLSVSQKEIEEVCGQLGPELRDGTKELFDQLQQADVPVLVFSAGLGDTVKAVMKHFDVNLPNVEKTRSLKGTNIWIDEDYPKEVQEERRKLVIKMKETRNKGYKAQLRYNKLIIIDELYREKDTDQNEEGKKEGGDGSSSQKRLDNSPVLTMPNIVEKKWNNIENAIKKSTEKNINQKKAQKRKELLDNECDEEIKKKHKLREKYLQTGNDTDGKNI